jgi:hypothetical protein
VYQVDVESTCCYLGVGMVGVMFSERAPLYKGVSLRHLHYYCTLLPPPPKMRFEILVLGVSNSIPLTAASCPRQTNSSAVLRLHVPSIPAKMKGCQDQKICAPPKQASSIFSSTEHRHCSRHAPVRMRGSRAPGPSTVGYTKSASVIPNFWGDGAKSWPTIIILECYGVDHWNS